MVPPCRKCRAAGVPDADLAVCAVRYCWKESGEKVCRRLLRSGLREPRLELGREGESRSALLVSWTSGLVGGRNVNAAEGDCEIAGGRTTGVSSLPSVLLKVYDVVFRNGGTAAAGKDRFHGATGEVARKVAGDAMLVSAPPSRSRKSPECRAERGRAISRPADA